MLASTIGWNAPIDAPQVLQRPRRNSQANTGTLRWAGTSVPQAEHRLRPPATSAQGRMVNRSPNSLGPSSGTGSRSITTQLNDPMARPNSVASTINMTVSITPRLVLACLVRTGSTQIAEQAASENRSDLS